MCKEQEVIYLVLAAPSSATAVGEEGVNIGIELRSSGDGSTFSDVDDDVFFVLVSPEKCKL